MALYGPVQLGRVVSVIRCIGVATAPAAGTDWLVRGLRYGRRRYPMSFSRLPPHMLPYCNFRSLTPGVTNTRVMRFESVPHLKSFDGYGISTVCASTTPFGLALAPG